MNRIVCAVLALAVSAGAALAQGTGQLASGNVWGNPGASRAPAVSATMSQMFDRALCGTNSSTVVRLAGSWTCATQAQLTALVNTFTTTLSGAVPAPGSVTGKVLTDSGWGAGGGVPSLTTNHMFIGNAGAATDAPMTGDCTISYSAGNAAIVCLKTNGTAFVASATTDTTNASNISSGTLAAARGGAGTITGALKGNGAGLVSQAACADLSNGAASCSTDTTNATNISSGTLNTARLPSPFTSGTRSGSTSTFATTTGVLTSGDCVKIDVSGNLVDAGAACGTGGGSNTAFVDDFVAGVGFTGGSTTQLTLSHTPSVQQIATVYFDGVAQAQNTWSLAGAVITFNQAIPVQVQVVEAQYYTAATVAGVSSLNGLTGTLSIGAGNGVTVSPSGSTVTVSVDGVSSVTANYTIATTDCGKTVQAGTGATGLFTVTLPAVAGFSTQCKVTVVNADTARGKKLSGFPSDINAILWPLQGLQVRINAAGTAWETVENPGRWKLLATQEICVRQDGSNTSDGLGDGTVAADCMATIQNAVTTIGVQWDGGGYNACNVGIHAGGTSTFSEAVNQTGQSIGCYLTLNIYDNITWGSTSSCYAAGDGSIAIFNVSNLKTLTLNCNTSNAASSGAILGHQVVIYDINGPGTYKWNSGGANDNFLFMDAQGRATLNAPFTIGDGTARSGNTFITCDAHCAGIVVSGTITTAASMTLGRMYALYGGSWMTLSASYVTTGTVSSASLSSGNSTLITNGTAVPTGTTNTGTGGAGLVCTTKC